MAPDFAVLSGELSSAWAAPVKVTEKASAQNAMQAELGRARAASRLVDRPRTASHRSVPIEYAGIVTRSVDRGRESNAGGTPSQGLWPVTSAIELAYTTMRSQLSAMVAASLATSSFSSTASTSAKRAAVAGCAGMKSEQQSS